MFLVKQSLPLFSSLVAKRRWDPDAVIHTRSRGVMLRRTFLFIIISVFVFTWFVHTIGKAFSVNQPSLNNVKSNKPIFLSVIIVANSNRYGLLELLRSIKNQTTNFRYEIIIADIGCMSGLKNDIRSSLTLPLPTEAITDLNYYYKDYQYLRFCDKPGSMMRNHCAETLSANTSELILFLNEDLYLRDSTFFQSMVDLYTIQSDTAGGVGCMVLNVDGRRVLEAGSIVWSDGSTMGFAHDRSDFDKSGELMYARPVDYVSGSCLMIDRNVLSLSGGFDTKLFSAYYEDTDLQMKIQHLYKKRIWLQPKAVALHDEYSSSTLDVSLLKKAEAIFKKRWNEYLLQHHLFPGPLDKNPVLQALRASDLRGRTTSQEHPTILYIDEKVPSKFHDGDSKYSFDNLLVLSQMGFRVTLFVLFDRRYGSVSAYHKRMAASRDDMITGYGDLLDDSKEVLQQSGIEVIQAREGTTTIKKLLVDRQMFYNVIVINSKGAYNSFKGALTGTDDYEDLSKNIGRFAFVYSCFHLTFHREQTERKLLQDLMKNNIVPPGLTQTYANPDTTHSIYKRANQNAEMTPFTYVDAAVMASNIDRIAVEHYLSDTNKTSVNNDTVLVNSKVSHIMNFDVTMSASDPPTFEQRNGVLFVGSFENTNMYGSGDSIWYFLHHIYPILAIERPDISITIVGLHIPQILADFVRSKPLYEYKVKLVEDVKHVNKFYDGARVVIAPDLYNYANLTQFTLSALAAGVPLVISNVTAQELGASIMDATCLGSSPDVFKKCVLTLHDDKKEWSKLHMNALDFSRRFYLKNNSMTQWRRVLDTAIETKELRGSFVSEFGTETTTGPGSAICIKVDDAYLERYIDAKNAVTNGTYSDGLHHFLSQNATAGYVYNLQHEEAYLKAYPPIARRVKANHFSSGWHHFQTVYELKRLYIYSPEDEDLYLERYLDIARALQRDEFKSGWEHYFKFGKSEGRIYGCY